MEQSGECFYKEPGWQFTTVFILVCTVVYVCNPQSVLLIVYHALSNFLFALFSNSVTLLIVLCCLIALPLVNIL